MQVKIVIQDSTPLQHVAIQAHVNSGLAQSATPKIRPVALPRVSSLQPASYAEQPEIVLATTPRPVPEPTLLARPTAQPATAPRAAPTAWPVPVGYVRVWINNVVKPDQV